jgi:hypothetical protein
MNMKMSDIITKHQCNFGSLGPSSGVLGSKKWKMEN